MKKQSFLSKILQLCALLQVILITMSPFTVHAEELTSINENPLLETTKSDLNNKIWII